MNACPHLPIRLVIPNSVNLHQILCGCRYTMHMIGGFYSALVSLLQRAKHFTAA